VKAQHLELALNEMFSDEEGFVNEYMSTSTRAAARAAVAVVAAVVNNGDDKDDDDTE
jgi:hypothetical protein